MQPARSANNRPFYGIAAVLIVLFAWRAAVVKIRADKIRARDELPQRMQAAIAANDLTAVRQLLNEGMTGTPRILKDAAMNGNCPLIALLLEHGLDPDSFSAGVMETMGGITPLMRACGANDPPHLDVARLLLEHGARVNATTSDGDTALLWAATKNIEIVRLLLDHGAKVNQQSVSGATPLTLASNDAILKLLLDHGANPNLLENDGSGALVTALNKGKPQQVALLLQHGANVRARARTGCTLLHAAAMQGKPATMKFLLDKGADVQAADRDGRTPLHRAALHGSLSAVTILLAHGAKADVVDKRGVTPLMLAAGAPIHAPEMMQALKAKGAQLERQDSRGNTALLWAVDRRRPDAVAALLKMGADVRARNARGQSARIIAEHFHHDAIMQLLAQVNAPE